MKTMMLLALALTSLTASATPRYPAIWETLVGKSFQLADGGTDGACFTALQPHEEGYRSNAHPRSVTVGLSRAKDCLFLKDARSGVVVTKFCLGTKSVGGPFPFPSPVFIGGSRKGKLVQPTPEMQLAAAMIEDIRLSANGGLVRSIQRSFGISSSTTRLLSKGDIVLIRRDRSRGEEDEDSICLLRKPR